jgi:RND family efflux transporter MFP subunit
LHLSGISKDWKQRMRSFLVIAAAIALISRAAAAADSFTVVPATVADEKAVFATVESINVVPARARIGGTVVERAVKEGDQVQGGQVVATIGDEKIALQMKSLDAQIAGLDAQLTQAQTDLTRAEDLFSRGTIPKTRLDEARTAINVATNAHRARIAERAVVAQQIVEGAVLAPTAGRVLKVPVTTGTVVMSGEPIAMVAEQNFVLRLRVPERHARFLRAGDPVRLDREQLNVAGGRFGTIRLVYPQIEDGRVIADAQVDGLGDYFVGERIRVWVSGGERTAIIVPSSFITTRFGVDYARVQTAGGNTIDVPVQRGRDLPRADNADGIEILSGLKSGDRLVGSETSAEIKNPSTIKASEPPVRP